MRQPGKKWARDPASCPLRGGLSIDTWRRRFHVMARLDWDISLDIVLMRMERQAQAMT
jgi:hypothetical protein